MGLPFVVQNVALTFLGCWAVIVPALVIHFQQIDHLILLDEITNVKTGI
jgi:hypothetical protein